jgi:SAM-dependent methyltransferase/uncharacterized protein YbaR (Trm112 family)
VRPRLLELLRCPACKGTLACTEFSAGPDPDEVVEGVLRCGCGRRYPIIDTVPRMLPETWALFPDFTGRHRERLGGNLAGARPVAGGEFDRLLHRTRESFGYQWTTFSEMVCDFQENFWNYLYPATSEILRSRLGLDAGCGFGRHIYHAAACGAEMVGMDFSKAIDSTRRNTRHLPNVHLVQGDIYAPPFAEGVFDFVYSIGVLHHLPDPVGGLRSLTPLLRPGGLAFIWVYSKTRSMTNFLVELVRTVTTRLPHPLVNGLAFVGAAVDQYVFVLPYQILRHLPVAGRLVERLTLARIKMYSAYPFGVLHADWFDRLAAPIRFYYSEQEVERLAQQAGISDVKVTPTGAYGWRACGVRR